MDQALAMPLAGKDFHAGEDPSLLSPSQNVEVRFHHPQLLVRNSPLEGTITSPLDDESTEHEIFGRRMEHSSSLSSLSNRFRSRDSPGSGLRRAVTGTPAVQKLTNEQESIEDPAGSLFSPNRVKNSGITPRKIIGFESSISTRGGAGRNSATHQSGGRKETFSHNRLIGETPASTHTDPSSPQWLFGASVKGKSYTNDDVDIITMLVIASLPKTSLSLFANHSKTDNDTSKLLIMNIQLVYFYEPVG